MNRNWLKTRLEENDYEADLQNRTSYHTCRTDVHDCPKHQEHFTSYLRYDIETQKRKFVVSYSSHILSLNSYYC